LPYATGSAELAITVRGSSRRIKIMRFRPANIRLINRRSNLLRLLLALSSKNKESNDNKKKKPGFTAVDTVTPYQGMTSVMPIRSIESKGLQCLRENYIPQCMEWHISIFRSRDRFPDVVYLLMLWILVRL
jgi:hypothetical protein